MSWITVVQAALVLLILVAGSGCSRSGDAELTPQFKDSPPPELFTGQPLSEVVFQPGQSCPDGPVVQIAKFETDYPLLEDPSWILELEPEPEPVTAWRVIQRWPAPLATSIEKVSGNRVLVGFGLVEYWLDPQGATYDLTGSIARLGDREVCPGQVPPIEGGQPEKWSPYGVCFIFGDEVDGRERWFVEDVGCDDSPAEP